MGSPYEETEGYRGSEPFLFRDEFGDFCDGGEERERERERERGREGERNENENTRKCITLATVDHGGSIVGCL